MKKRESLDLYISFKKNIFKGTVLLCLSVSSDFAAAQMAVRIKDIVTFEGIRENQLVGYGLVVGLKGTGDTLKDSPYALETMVSMLERLGVNIRDKATDMKSKNVAAVMVTASLPAFARHGTPLDVRVSAIGTAKDLLGGTLLVTPLMGADGEVYAVAQGPLVTGGFSAEGQSGSSVTKGVPTSARIANGALVEKEIPFELDSLKSIRLSLRNPDMTTAGRVAAAINAHTPGSSASAQDPSTVNVALPTASKKSVMDFLTSIEQLRVIPDQTAKVIIDEQNGVIVMGKNVRISSVAVSHGNLTIRISETPQVSQPNPFSTTGSTVVVPRTSINVNEEGKKMTVLEEGVTLQELVDHLNALGVSPRDMITILRTIKASGALQAEIEVI
ncbi:MAG: flagellar basal body P-ring protein FlgI [Alphaproteobacteria bacterium]|nr:flagellar basal body P-ring protein FlgI [Alphaproteobacteria bacterium]